MTISDEKVSGKQWQNRTSEYYLVSVKQRLKVDFRNSLKREKKRHGEPKAQGVIPLRKSAIDINFRIIEKKIQFDNQ